MPDKKLTKVINGELVLLIGSSDNNSDWLKQIDKGNRQKKDLRATEEALKKYNEAEK